jgi:general nucleoside transport system ATP-binding protein
MRVELSHIHKHFGKVHANNDIHLTIPAGTIQGILGENGAGKSTLMKILSGFIQADEGEIRLDDKPILITNPADAIVHGIGMLHQDPLDFPPMRVIDNFLIGRHETGLFPDRKQAQQDLCNLEKQFDFNIDPETYVDTLTVGERQQLEILRLLWLGARVLILDEPTTGISALQRDKLFATLKKLVAQGMTVIFVSHKLEEVEGLCGRVAVLQRGRLVGETQPPYKTMDLVQMMFGKVVQPDQRVNAAQKDCALTVQDLSIEDYRLQIRDVNVQVSHGEVIGLAGMEGSGQRQFLRTLGGLMRPVAGKMVLDGGKNLAGKPYPAFMHSGISYMPAARLEEGLIPGLTLTEHFILCNDQHGFFINKEKALKTTTQAIQDFTIRGTPENQIETLSGGNQQRALLSLLRMPLRLLLMEHPTRGLDIESTIYIWAKLKERCRQGTSIVFISADLDEIIRYSDRILVFFGGRVSEPIDAATTSVEKLGQLIGGKGW